MVNVIRMLKNGHLTNVNCNDNDQIHARINCLERQIIVYFLFFYFDIYIADRKATTCKAFSAPLC